MQRIQAALSARQLRSLLDQKGDLATQMPSAYAVFMRLRAASFHICDVHLGSAVVVIHLGCGAVVSVYQKGTVMVQGRMHGSTIDTREELERLLPASAVWQLARR